MTAARILAVDDEPRAIELLVRGLRGLGEVITAASGDEGFARLQEGDFDLVISDQRMPGMTGVELLTHVAARDETTGRVLLTGYADFEATTAAINEGRVHAYLSKPCPAERLHEVVLGVLRRVRKERRRRRLLLATRARNRVLEAALRSLRDEDGELT